MHENEVLEKDGIVNGMRSGIQKPDNGKGEDEMYVLQPYDIYVFMIYVGMACVVLYVLWWVLRFKVENKDEEKEFFTTLIADSWIPKTYRTIFGLYLKWKAEQQ